MRVFEPGGPARYAHQTRALRRMIELRGTAALLMDPGTGKTAVVLDYACLLALKQGRARVLVVCPLAAVDTWVSQAQQFCSPQVSVWAEALGGTIDQRRASLDMRAKGEATPQDLRRSPALFVRDLERGELARPLLASPKQLVDPAVRLLVVNLDVFSSRRRVGSTSVQTLLLRSIEAFSPDLVVVDESHKIKGASSNVSRAMARVGAVVPRRAILTGTVMPHSPLDVFGQWRFLDPYAFSPNGKVRATYSDFKMKYARIGGYMGYQVLGFKNLESMQQIMARRSVVIRKEDALDLPPTTDVVVPVNLSTAEKAAYAAMKKDLVARLDAGERVSVPNRLAQMMRLRQITSGYAPDDLSRVAVEIGSSKIDTIRSIVNDTLLGERRVVVFCEFLNEIERLEKALARAGTEVVTVTGQADPKERKAVRARFGSSSPKRIVLVAQVRTLNLSVNELVSASHAVFGSLSLRRDENIQARDRLNRIGQTRPVTYWYAVVPRSVDEVILAAHRDREDLEAAMLRHIRGEASEG